MDGTTGTAAPGSGGCRWPRRLAAAVVLVDQLTKWWALHRLSSGPIHVIGTLDFELARNTGASFSLFQGKAFILVPVAVVLVAALGVMAWRAPTAGPGRHPRADPGRRPG